MMNSPIAQEYLSIVNELDTHLTLPTIKQVWLPEFRDDPDKSAEFGAVILDDGSVGLVFTLLGDTLRRMQQLHTLEIYCGESPVELAQLFLSMDPVERALGLGAINAIGQYFIRHSQVALDTKTNSIASFDPQQKDRMGMVGFFPPLVERLRAENIDLTVIELKEELVQQQPRFRVTMDPAALQQCNKILCTSTLLLNDSLDTILNHCQQAEQVAIIGPSAGFLPDPLFRRGFSTLGGNQVLNVDAFIQRCSNEEKWGDSARKYCFHKHSYPGYKALLANLVQ